VILSSHRNDCATASAGITGRDYDHEPLSILFDPSASATIGNDRRPRTARERVTDGVPGGPRMLKPVADRSPDRNAGVLSAHRQKASRPHPLPQSNSLFVCHAVLQQDPTRGVWMSVRTGKQ